MKILHTDQNGWGGKINFVDDNNVLVGFDNSSNCCEQFGWFISETVPTEVNYDEAAPPDLDGYQFDTAFFKSDYFSKSEWGDTEGVAIFRIVNGDKELFLTLYNSHNGYYSHGFEMEVGGKTIYEGNL